MVMGKQKGGKTRLQSSESHASIVCHTSRLEVLQFYPCRGTGALNLDPNPWALLDIGWDYPVLLDGMGQIIEFLDALFPNDASWAECEAALEEEMIHGESPWIYDMRQLISEAEAVSVEFRLGGRAPPSIGGFGLPSNSHLVLLIR